MKGTTLFIVFMAIVLAGTAIAVSPGKKVEYEGGPLGKVVFYGAAHDEAGYRCMDCHNKVFSIRPSEKSRITVSDHVHGKLCGVCHNGEKSFSVEDKEDCSKCHKESN
jgi:c(7)-type cytochrome triheme protein